MSEPLTLAEFNKRLDQMVLYDGAGEAECLPDTLGALILRLLAGERERCANWCAQQANALGKRERRFGEPAPEKGAFIEAANAIRTMGDPT